MPWYRKLHWQIILGLILGVIYGTLAAARGWGAFTNDWITPFGTVFMNGLRLIAVPLVLGSLITGVASLSDLKKLSRIGGKTIGIYIGTTVVAVTLGLVIVNVLRPGDRVPDGMRQELAATFSVQVSDREAAATAAQERGPLQLMVDIVPTNVFQSISDNRNMLQVVFLAMLMGIGLIQVPPDKAKPLLGMFEGLTQVIIRLVDLIMKIAPIGVFSLIASTITSVAGDDPNQIVQLLSALAFYMVAVILGLLLQTLVVYPILLRLMSPMPWKTFFKGIAPAQLVAFTTSSSGATLPVTMERVEEKLGVSEEVTSFVLPLGATINMDGTALYQAVAAVFIAQTLGMSLSIGAQLTIVLTAVLASIGTAAVPGAGIIMLVIILEAIGVPTAGIALILGVDRILDMMRTVTNVTGDAAVATVVAASENALSIPDLGETANRIRA
ncbi:MAG: dicarboxylate/amino acid:cation symporter [Planctomycetota bacterium]|nr:dicarboxylate/amino acid:cation symporter [Planctomycetota bacterium]